VREGRGEEPLKGTLGGREPRGVFAAAATVWDCSNICWVW